MLGLSLVGLQASGQSGLPLGSDLGLLIGQLLVEICGLFTEGLTTRDLFLEDRYAFLFELIIRLLDCREGLLKDLVGAQPMRLRQRLTAESAGSALQIRQVLVQVLDDVVGRIIPLPLEVGVTSLQPVRLFLAFRLLEGSTLRLALAVVVLYSVEELTHSCVSAKAGVSGDGIYSRAPVPVERGNHIGRNCIAIGVQ